MPHVATTAISVSKNCSLEWQVIRRCREGEPICTVVHIDRVRLQVYRHVARPDAWTAYARGLLADVVLTATELDKAQHEALAILRHACIRQEPDVS